MNDASLLTGVVHAMGLLVATQEVSAGPGEPERFRWGGQVPEWAQRFGCSADAPCDPAGSFAFMEFFLDEARLWWSDEESAAGGGVLRSEAWAEPDAEGIDHQLEAVALRVGDARVLVVAGVSLEFTQAQSILQTARERRLAMDQELAVRQLVESELRQRVAQRTAELDASNRQLRDLAAQVALAEQRERHRLAIGLHDHIGQLLAVTKIQLSAESAKSSDDGQQRRLNETIQRISEAIDATRSLTFELSPPMLYEMGLVPTLASLVEQTGQRHAPLTCTFEDDGQDKPLAGDVEILLFQVVRELITNVLKHAEAKRMSVSTTREGPRMVLAVEDDGRGLDVVALGKPRVGAGGFGLLSAKERLSHVGARLDLESPVRPDNEAMADAGALGTRATIVVPLKLG